MTTPHAARPYAGHPALGTTLALARALRPHQWAKNALLLLPALAAHVAWSVEQAARVGAGVLAFCLLASAVYLVNDVVDAPLDRLHPEKRHRPVAAGALPAPLALVATVLLVLCAAAVAVPLPPAFQGVLVAYVVVTTAYSLALKHRPLVDVLVLALLYTSRVVAGAALVEVPLSPWFLAFSIFFFLSLALAKRVVELRRHTGAAGGAARGYLAADLPVLAALGTASVVASSLVYGLYITDEDVARLYRTPALLWAGLPILLYWQARIWLLTMRDVMHHDPVVFALRDSRSWALFAALLMIVALAAR